ncbi:hypothetical protein CY34DRAFT_813381 [Suillus luteus UH-Slu-Lm8-n1]|uniref:Uncharacterized protein n=1 Tax=Suillus luteus UH-Slu-Lm8-n1 TaxID=930992 RepID=A0A0C9Z8B2_9AGAM|nr:hypothetical protein CY34DRAFT_813381 [Suillus luteus UH-Slu-Lm8-n1]
MYLNAYDISQVVVASADFLQSRKTRTLGVSCASSRQRRARLFKLQLSPYELANLRTTRVFDLRTRSTDSRDRDTRVIQGHRGLECLWTNKAACKLYLRYMTQPARNRWLTAFCDFFHLHFCCR